MDLITNLYKLDRNTFFIVKSIYYLKDSKDSLHLFFQKTYFEYLTFFESKNLRQI